MEFLEENSKTSNITNFFVVKQSKPGLDQLVLRLLDHMQLDTHTPSMSDQFITADASYTTHNKCMRQTLAPSVGLDPTIPAIERPQTYYLENMANKISNSTNAFLNLSVE
jgi:hypothetical protein